MAVTMKIAIFWDLTKSSLTVVYQRFYGIYWLHMQCIRLCQEWKVVVQINGGGGRLWPEP
jgi:hypothetical protein